MTGGAVRTRAAGAGVAAASPTRWPPAGPPSGFRSTSPPRTAVSRHVDAGIAAARPGAPGRQRSAPSRPWPACVTRTATAARSASPQAVLRLAQDDPRAATAALAPVLDGSAPVLWPNWLIRLSCWRRSPGTHSATGPPPARARACPRYRRARRMLLFVPMLPAPGLLERHARDCAKHAALVSEILTLLPPLEPGPAEPAPDGYPGPKAVRGSGKPPRDKEWSGGDRSPGLIEPLSRSEMRVLRYLPTNLSGPGDRPGTVGVGDHRADAHKPPVRQTRRPPPHRGRRAGPRSGPARTIPHAPRWSAPRNRIMPGPTLLGVNVATTWPASALAPGLANHHARWPPGSACPDFARLGGPTALGIASANTLTR